MLAVFHEFRAVDKTGPAEQQDNDWCLEANHKRDGEAEDELDVLADAVLLGDAKALGERRASDSDWRSNQLSGAIQRSL